MGQGVTVSSNKSTIINNWVQLNQASSILFNKITNEQIQRHALFIINKSELLAYSKRMQEHSSNICRIIYFCPRANTQSNLSIMSDQTSNLRAKSSTSMNDKSTLGTQANTGQIKKQYLIFTDRMIPIKEWTREKIINIIKVLKKLVNQYGCFKIREKCLCQNQRKQIKIWINQNATQNHIMEQVDAQQDMIADLAAVLVSKKQKVATELIGVTAFDEVIQKLSRNIQKNLHQADYIKEADVRNSQMINKDKKGKPVQVNNYYNVFINTDNNYATGHSLQNSHYNSLNPNSSYVQPKSNFKVNQVVTQPNTLTSLNQTNLFVNLQKKKVDFSNKFNRAIITSSKQKIQRIEQEQHSPSRKLKAQNLSITDPNKYNTESSYTKRAFEAPNSQQLSVKAKAKVDGFLSVNQDGQQKKINSSVPKFLKGGQFSKQKRRQSGQIIKNAKMVGFGQKNQILNRGFSVSQNSLSKNNIKGYNTPIYPFKEQVNSFQSNRYLSTINKNIMHKTQESQKITNNRQVSSHQSKKFQFGTTLQNNQSRRQSDISDFSEHHSISNNSGTGSLNQNARHTPFYVKTNTSTNTKDIHGEIYTNYNFNKPKNTNQLHSKSKAKQGADYYKKYEHLELNGTHKLFIGYKNQNNFKHFPQSYNQDMNKILIQQKKQKPYAVYEQNKILSNFKQQTQHLGDNKTNPTIFQQRKKYPSTYESKNLQPQNQTNQKLMDKKNLKFQKSSLKSQNSGQINAQNSLLKPSIQTNYLKKSTNSYYHQEPHKKVSTQFFPSKDDNYKNFSYLTLENKRLEYQAQKAKFQYRNQDVDITRNLSLPYPNVPQRKAERNFTFQQIQQPVYTKNNYIPVSSNFSNQLNRHAYNSNKANPQKTKLATGSKKDQSQNFAFYRTTSGDVEIGNNCSIVNHIQKQKQRGGINQSDPGKKTEKDNFLAPKSSHWKDSNQINTYGSLIHSKQEYQTHKFSGKGLTSNFSAKKQTQSVQNYPSCQKAEYIQPDPLVKKSLKKQIQMECIDLFGQQILNRPDQQEQQQTYKKQIQQKNKVRKDRRSSSPAPISSQNIDIKDIDDSNDNSSLLNNVSSKDLYIKQKVQKKKAKYAELKSQFSNLFG